MSMSMMMDVNRRYRGCVILRGIDPKLLKPPRIDFNAVLLSAHGCFGEALISALKTGASHLTVTTEDGLRRYDDPPPWVNQVAGGGGN